MSKRVKHIYQLTLHKEKNVHVPYENQQNTRKKIISLHYSLTIILKFIFCFCVAVVTNYAFRKQSEFQTVAMTGV